MKDDKSSRAVDRFKDYRGLACPINFVKVKLDLEAMKVGETLKVRGHSPKFITKCR